MLPARTYGGMPAALRWLFWVYFATHIPITILIDAQVRSDSFFSGGDEAPDPTVSLPIHSTLYPHHETNDRAPSPTPTRPR